MCNGLRDKLESIITLHDKMKGSYFFTPPGNAASRRAYEKNNSMETVLVLQEGDGDKEITVKQVTSCSAKNIYYRMTLSNGKDIRYIKKLLKECC